MADNKYNKLLDILKSMDDNNTGKECSAMLSPHDTKLDKIEREIAKLEEAKREEAKREDAKREEAKRAATKERAVNPMAIRPSGAHVTLTEEKPAVSVIKRLFGF